jgi:hypothetical protein
MVPLHRAFLFPSATLVSLLVLFASGHASAQNRFAQAAVYPMGGYIFSPVVADFNGDGRADVLSIVQYNDSLGMTSRELVLAKPDAQGSYANRTVVSHLPNTENAGEYLAAGDFNEDGKQDFAVMNSAPRNPAITVYIGRGDGTFTAKTPFQLLLNTPQEANSVSSSFLSGKITRSGHVDLVVGVSTNVNGDFYDTGVIHIVPGNGDGTFGTPKATVTTINPLVLALGDVNLDGHQDVALDGTGSYQLLLGNGDGTFRVLASVDLPPNVALLTGSMFYDDVAVLDVTGDGAPDLVFANSGSGPVGVVQPSILAFQGFGDGTFHTERIYYDTGNAGTSLAVGDLNGDGYPDVVVANEESSTVGVRFGSSKGAGGAVITKYAVTHSGSGLVRIGDANGDGRQDVLFFSPELNAFQVLLNTGGGNLRAPRAVDIHSALTGLQASDLNHDGYADLAALGFFPIDISNSIFDANHRLFLALGVPGQTMNAITTDIVGSQSPAIQNEGPHYVALANFNQDGNLDIATDGGVSFNNGHAQFTAHSTEPPTLGKSPHTLADYNTVAGDLNHDGKADLVSVGATSLTVSLGNGDSTFKSPVQ